jgi:hypothetical protein
MNRNPAKTNAFILTGMVLAIVFFATSCSLHIEKRRYRKGYYIEMGSYLPKGQIPSVQPVSSAELVKLAPTPFQPNKTIEIKDSITKENIPMNNRKKTVIHSKRSIPDFKPSIKKADHCDIITFTDGTQLEIVVEEISETEIKYKKCNFTDGPSYRVSKSNVKRIDMYNGQVYRPEDTKGKTGNGGVNGQIITSLVLGILAFILLIIGIVLVFTSYGFIPAAALAPTGILSLIGLIIGATTLHKGAHPLAWVAFFLNLFVQVFAIIFTILMFYM